MARYIDADALVRAISLYANRTSLGQICPPDLSYIEMLDIIADAPTADVAPRAEVEKWFRECEELQGRMIEVEKEIRKEIATEIFEEIDQLITNYFAGVLSGVTFIVKIAELKKRYTEENQ